MLGEPEPTPLLVRVLLRIGFVRLKDDRSVRWPFHVTPRHMWHYILTTEPWLVFFRNRPNIIKWQKGRLLPRRWGFRFLVFEFGDRG